MNQSKCIYTEQFQKVEENSIVFSRYVLCMCMMCQWCQIQNLKVNACWVWGDQPREIPDTMFFLRLTCTVDSASQLQNKYCILSLISSGSRYRASPTLGQLSIWRHWMSIFTFTYRSTPNFSKLSLEKLACLYARGCIQYIIVSNLKLLHSQVFHNQFVV